jgi:hypothetical protein
MALSLCNVFCGLSHHVTLSGKRHDLDKEPMDEQLGHWLRIFVTGIISGPMRISAVGPGDYCLFVQLTVSALQYGAEPGKVALNLVEIFRRNFLPLHLQRTLELFPKLPELFLIHHVAPWLVNGSYWFPW